MKYKYRNKKTQAVITTACVISGKDWEEVTEPAKTILSEDYNPEEPDTEEETELSEEQDIKGKTAVQEAVKKTASRTVKKTTASKTAGKSTGKTVKKSGGK